jgi:C4-dicarboxylate transporter DctM subunit
MEKWVGLLSDKLNLSAGYVAGFFILIIGVIVTYDVLARYLFNAPTVWVLEISIILGIGAAFLGGGYCLREKNHINVDNVISKLSRPNRILVELMGLIFSTIYCFVLTWKGLILTIVAFQTGEVSPTVLNIPVWIPLSFVPLGGALLMLEFIRQIMTGISDWRNTARGELRTGNWVRRNLPPIIFLALLALGGFLYSSIPTAPYGVVLVLFVLIFGGMPIAFALGLLGLMGFLLTFGGSGAQLTQVPLVAYKILDDFVIVAVPLFITVSTVLSIGAIGAALFDVAAKFVQHLPGGLAVAAIGACAIFAAMNGSSTATVATIGLIAIPEMLRRGYERKLTFGTLAIGGVLGPLIPPSIFMILIGAMTGDSVGKLFMAGMLPGIMLAVFFSVYIILYSWKRKDRVILPRCSWGERWAALKGGVLGLLTPIIILGGIYAGIFTPTEAAAIGMIYALFICIFLYRTISFAKFLEIISGGAKFNAMILWIVTSALVFGQIVTMLQIPDLTVKYLANLDISPMSVLFLGLFFVLILGALMDEASILLITYPTFYYVFVTKFGFDSIWFALVYVFTLEVGLVAPPVGINIFVVQGLDKTAKFDEVVMGVLPFALIMIAAILLVVYVKPLSLWLPGLIG